ncbi:50S ribosomal protein L28 domain protein [Ostertagia ostertagi]
MTFYTIGWAVIAVMHLCCFSNAELPGELMPSVSEQGAKVRPIFAAVPNVDGWYIWHEEETSACTRCSFKKQHGMRQKQYAVTTTHTWLPLGRKKKMILYTS